MLFVDFENVEGQLAASRAIRGFFARLFARPSPKRAVGYA